ncbi:S-adenosylmethionine mitochondrial carrier protein-like [Pectinophora gossypiella]|uniref:S-adenosylmethionine mitochondrial carrier protein-like n=1 Tax=Pectinophora gossypiella TaxID=13191 RepID=UPI00214DF472|nr:S-adenosylmethionine mitochondrial carrier protein-like [Pectinophora gossypiella]
MELSKKGSMSSLYLSPLLAGAVAGFSVDVTLYPLDTLKTRLQSQQGFHKAGGFRGVYKGLMTVVATSMPMSALFFMSYEGTKSTLLPHAASHWAPAVHMFAASVGEVFACVIRVPAEIAKQRKQTYVGSGTRSAISILLEAYKSEGMRKGVYRGFLSTVARDLPFSFIELPVWELMKATVRQHNNGEITSLQSAVCGSLAGGFAAAATTPLDLAKTRIMLAEHTTSPKLRVLAVLEHTYCTRGLRGLFAGVAPRTTAFMIGGFVFFGVYDDVKAVLEKKFS